MKIVHLLERIFSSTLSYNHTHSTKISKEEGDEKESI